MVGGVEIGDGAGEFQDAVVGAGGELQLLDRSLEQAIAGFVEPAVILDLGWSHIRVELGAVAAVAVGLSLPGGGDTVADSLRGLSGPSIGQLVVFDPRDFQMNVDPIHQGTGDPLLVAGDRRWRAGAVLHWISGKPTRAPLRCPLAMSP